MASPLYREERRASRYRLQTQYSAAPCTLAARLQPSGSPYYCQKTKLELNHAQLWLPGSGTWTSCPVLGSSHWPCKWVAQCRGFCTTTVHGTEWSTRCGLCRALPALRILAPSTQPYRSCCRLPGRRLRPCVTQPMAMWSLLATERMCAAGHIARWESRGGKVYMECAKAAHCKVLGQRHCPKQYDAATGGRAPEWGIPARRLCTKHLVGSRYACA